MNPIKLLRETDQQPTALACAKCGAIWALFAERNEWAIEQATLCCDALARQAAEQRRNAEWKVRQAEKIQASKANARRVPIAEYTGGMLYSEERNRYYSGWEELVDDHECNDLPVPTDAWGTTGVCFEIPSAHEIVQRECENGDYHDDISDDVEASPELVAAVEAFNAAQTACSYHVDYDTLVLAPSPTKDTTV